MGIPLLKILEKNQIRELDALEKAHYSFAVENNSNISVIVRLKKPLPVAALERAVELMHEKHLFLRCAIAGQVPTYIEANTDPTIHILKKKSDSDWKRLSEELVHMPFDLEKGPLYSVAYLSGEKSHELIVTMHHAVSDATTLVQIASEIIRATLNHSAWLKEPEILSPATFSVEKHLAHYHKHILPPNSISSITPKPLTSHTSFIYKTLSKKATKAFLKKVKASKTSFQAYFSSTLLSHLAPYLPSQINYFCPIDLRPRIYLPSTLPGCHITLHTTALSPAASPETIDASLLSTLQNIPASLASLITPSPCSTPSLNIGVSNAGRLEEFYESKIASEVYINGVLDSKFMLHPVITCTDRLHMSFCFSDELISRAQLSDAINIAMAVVVSR